MKLAQVKQSLEYKNSTGRKLPADEVLQDMLYEAMIYVAQRCEPKELIASALAEFGERPLRNIENGCFIRLPEYPDFSHPERHLQIDEDLTFSVINFVMYLLTNTPDFKVLADEAIAIHRSNEGQELFGE